MLSLSVVVPVFNGEGLLARCLKTITPSLEVHDELIVVDDASTDSTYEIAKKVTCKVHRLSINRGPAAARNLGLQRAQGDIVVFVDADVSISAELIPAIRQHFIENEACQTLTMSVDTHDLGLGFWSDYKNLYMNFVIQQGAVQTNYVYGACCATRRKTAMAWPEERRLTEDSLWGLQQARNGLLVICRKDLQITHHKVYSLLSLVRNDFNIAVAFAESFISEKRWKTLYSSEAFGHISKIQKLSVMLVSFCVLSTLFLGVLSVLFVVVWGMLNLKFWNHLRQNRGLLFTLLGMAWTFVDHLIYAAGIASGVFYWVFQRKACNESLSQL